MKFGFRELLFFIVLLGFLAGTYFFVFAKANQKREALRLEILQKQQALADLQVSTAGIEDLNKRIKDLQEAIAYFESKLPQEKEFDKILEEVSNMASANSLQSKAVRTLKTERCATYSEQPIQIGLSGNFNGFYLFLQQLEKLPRITRITGMSLQKIQERDGDMQATMTLSIFFEPLGSTTTMAGAQ
jgi:type IV pilus assembly protein PilO